MHAVVLFGLCALVISFNLGETKIYKPDWKDLDSRPLPAWYDEAKVGIFLHWGVFSQIGFHSEWVWAYWKLKGSIDPGVAQYMKDNYPPDMTYADFAASFKAELFNPDEWAELFEKAGAKYVVLTSKHHEGFCNWGTKYSFNWNSVAVGPNKDLVGMFANSIRKKTQIKVGLYHSMFEWFNQVYLADKSSQFRNSTFPMYKTIPELIELVEKYKPELIWSDGDWEAADTYWKSREFLAWLYNDSPVKDTVVVNDRWGNNTYCKHGGYWNCQDKYNPGKLVGHKWENAMTVDDLSWGYIRDHGIGNIKMPEELVKDIVSTVSYGGNILINVGPMPDGTIPLIFQERLLQVGGWLKVNGEAIYGTNMWTHQNDTVTKNVWYTAKKNMETVSTDVYAMFIDWPKDDEMFLGAPTITSKTTITLLGYDKSPFMYEQSKQGSGVTIKFPVINYNDMPCQYAWVLKFTNLADQQIKDINEV